MITTGSETVRVVGPATVWHVGWHQLGIAIITENLRWAAVGMLAEGTTPRQAQRVTEAVCFVQGTALALTIEVFGLSLQADTLRETFDAWLRQRKTPYYP